MLMCGDYWFYAYAEGNIVYDLVGGDYAKFEAYFYMPAVGGGNVEAVELIFLADGEIIHKTGVLTVPQSQNIKIAFDIPSGTQKFTIKTEKRVDGINFAHYILANARLLSESFVMDNTETTETETTVTKDQQVVYLSFLGGDQPVPNEFGLTPKNPRSEWTHYRNLELADNKTNNGNDLIIGGRKFERGISVTPGNDYKDAVVVYDLTGADYTSFEGFLGISDEQDHRIGDNIKGCTLGGSVIFIFEIDNSEVYRSSQIAGLDPHPIWIAFDIPIDAKELTIIVNSIEDKGWCDAAVIGDAKLFLDDVKIEETPINENITYLTLSYDSPDALVPTNTTSEWSGWFGFIWEKTPDGQFTGKPQWYFEFPYIDVWGHWFYAHAESRIVYDISGGDYTRFEALLYLAHPYVSDQETASMEVICFADDKEIYNSGVLSNKPEKEENRHQIFFDMPAGAQELTIHVTEGSDGDGYDHFVFGNPRLIHHETPDPEVDDYNYTDVNNDGVVNIIDLVLVAVRYGETIVGNPFPNPDVNQDGIVDINDIILVTEDMPPVAPAAPSRFTDIDFQPAYTALPDAIVDKAFAVLEMLFGSTLPTKTLLLGNYPNPFNPETWIPYQLAKSADVVITIYAADGQVVRKLDLGHQDAGRYVSRSHAAYWNGRNALGESVASGLYFYTLTAGKFVATRRMLIRK